MRHRVNVFDFGVKGDGATDDTAAIQKAINHIVQAGGGVVYFPFTNKGYVLASPALEEVAGKPAKSQLYIARQTMESNQINICFEGEMPVMQLNSYNVHPWMRLREMKTCNTRLISTWEAPEQTDPAPRPYAMLSAVEGCWLRGKFGTGMVTIKNLEFRAFMNPDKMYPTGSCVNLQNVSRCLIQDSWFGLDKNVGDGELKTELQANPCHTAGVIMPGDQSDNQFLRNVGTQGFKYGFVLGEMLVADYLTIANCEEAIVVNGHTELSQIQHVVSQNNRIIVSALRRTTFGMQPSPFGCHVNFGAINFEHCNGEPGQMAGSPPYAYNMRYGVYDPDNRIRGSLQWYCGYPPNDDYFPVEGAAHLTIRRFFTPPVET